MKKALWLLCIMSIIGITVISTNLVSDDVEAKIPSASSYAPTFKDWSIYFSESMNPDTFTNDTVAVLDKHQNAVAVTFEWNEDNTILTVKSPENGYILGGNYQITLSDKVETMDGKNLSTYYTHSFQAVEELPKIKNKEQLLALLKERMELRPQQLYSVDETAEAADSGEEKPASNDSSTSETNVQVAGIDEGDSVKTDGNYLYFARDNDIVIASTNGNDSKVISTIHEEAYHMPELFLHENLLISIGRTHEPIRELHETASANEKMTDSFMPYSSQTSVYIYDVSDKANPKRIREFTMEGSLTSSRKMDGFLYFVVNNHPPYHYFREEGDLEDVDIRPFVKDTAVSNQGQPVDFDSMYFFPESTEDQFMLLSSIDLNNMEKEANVETYLGASNQLYMSENHLYTAVNKYVTSGTDDKKDIMIAQPADTEIVQFKIDNGLIKYNASTVVNGTLINQFAMDERNDTFRVATTKGDMWREEAPSTNNLYTFDIHLNPLGKVEGLAEGERIYSVRFMENVAYMVTFKQVDPLFVIDLQDAANPKVLGELKIPGFSNYLHPLDDDHVIGFGQHTELVDVEWSKEPQVRQRGLKISVFDVTDPANPKEKFTEILGEEGYSEVNHNHRALYKHPDKNLFGFPAQLFELKTVQKGDAVYEEHSFVYEGAFLYNISPETGLTLKDTITHQTQTEDMRHPEWESQMKRMVSVGETLYTLSFDQMKVYDMNEERIVKTIPFPQNEKSYYR
ncbi:putative secreted protein with C-terminal beta-propeller domain [Salirhabdus euzebyi]|uniref:Putative secreted protein with C-terminal beta-propeller domain n=1 Tax=Salirhabdus euzebyi TaxID=394506 RepID=A0A841PUX7_9BACI|nr:beta-propeller domain-containing protein [Salirhabdus euzebyi]MBB6452610.1 putative secreted protein with C-terminal beta-propeller domain [Salirhabdus euzebyi]